MIWNGTAPVLHGVEQYVRDWDPTPGMPLPDEDDVDL